MRVYKSNSSGYFMTNFRLGNEQKPILVDNKDLLIERLFTLQTLSDIIEPKKSNYRLDKRDLVFIPSSVKYLFDKCLCEENSSIEEIGTGIIDISNKCEKPNINDYFQEFDYYIYDVRNMKNFFDVYPIIQLVNTTNINTGIINLLKNKSRFVRNTTVQALIDYIYNPNLTSLKINDEYNYMQFMILDYIRIIN